MAKTKYLRKPTADEEHPNFMRNFIIIMLLTAIVVTILMAVFPPPDNPIPRKDPANGPSIYQGGGSNSH